MAPKSKTNEDIFWSKVNKHGPVPDQAKYPGLGRCWNWVGARNKKGYGQMHRYPDHRNVLAHRVSWELAFGAIPVLASGKTALIRHGCNNPHCVNPSHLKSGSHQDNMDDRNSQGRQAKGEANGRAKLTVEDVKEIRRLAAEGQMSKRALAIKFKVSRPTVRHIVERKLWRHI